MPNRRKPRKLTPGVSVHAGLCKTVSLNSQDSSNGIVSFGVNNENSSPKKKGNRVTRLVSQQEEGVLYTVKIVERPHQPHNPYKSSTTWKDGLVQRFRPLSVQKEEESPQSMQEPQQYTIDKMNKKRVTWCSRLLHSFGIELDSMHEDVDSHLYKPPKPLSAYLNWTFYASFTAVFLSFLIIFIVLCLLFAAFLLLAGNIQPDCIVVSGSDFGTNSNTKMADAFALSWTTFTTVGYGNTYPATGTDLEIAEAQHCSAVVFLCTLEAFLGLLFAGMCAAILFGKVNRVQAHAHVCFANAVCLQYEEIDTNVLVDDDASDSDTDCDILKEVNEEKAIESTVRNIAMLRQVSFHNRKTNFMAQFGCPILKFQVVNELCNKAGGEIIDGVMKVVGMKVKRWGGKATCSQYVRVNLVDFEHPFFGRVWHGVHILDHTSPLLTSAARKEIRQHGCWPSFWLESPSKIRKKLDFQHVVVTVSGLSNLSASTVHAYKRYKLEDVIVGFDFAPLVYEAESSGKLEVDLSLVDDVIEQYKGHGEDLKNTSTPLDGKDSSHSVNYSRGTSSIFRPSIKV